MDGHVFTGPYLFAPRTVSIKSRDHHLVVVYQPDKSGIRLRVYVFIDWRRACHTHHHSPTSKYSLAERKPPSKETVLAVFPCVMGSALRLLPSLLSRSSALLPIQ